MNLLRLLAASIPSSSVPNLPHTNAGTAQLDLIVNGVFSIAGAVTLLFVIIGGLRYVTSQGNSDAIRSAKEMIIYSFVGLVVVILAFSIVQIVILVVNR